jgi:BirA family biotin operon repressor/biotin-[acetyl-CoA-carboxylase] ligase
MNIFGGCNTKLQISLYKFLCNTLFVGKKVVYLPVCQSTNDISAELLREEPSEGTIVITDKQTKGRGQRGNTWEAEPGNNLTFSLILKPEFLTAMQQFALNQAVSLALYETVQQLLPSSEVSVKWPNDIYVGKRKIAGVLIENTLAGSQLRYSIIGIGLNVNQREFQHPQACSLHTENGQQYALPEVLEMLAIRLEQYYIQLRQGLTSQLRTAYEKRLYLKEKSALFIDLTQGKSVVFQGFIKGVDPIGRLQIETMNTLKLFSFKEVAYTDIQLPASD